MIFYLYCILLCEALTAWLSLHSLRFTKSKGKSARDHVNFAHSSHIRGPATCPRSPSRAQRTCPGRGPWRCALIRRRRGRRRHRRPPSAGTRTPRSSSPAWTWWPRLCLVGGGRGGQTLEASIRERRTKRRTKCLRRAKLRFVVGYNKTKKGWFF